MPRVKQQKVSNEVKEAFVKTIQPEDVSGTEIINPIVSDSYDEIVSFADLEFSELESQKRRRERLEEPAEKIELEKFAQNIKTYGILQLPTVRKLSSGKYQVVFGERRIRAAMIAGLTETKCTVRNLSDEMAAELQLSENLQRKDMHPTDEAFSYLDLQNKLNCSLKEIADRVGKDVSYISKQLKLLKLTPTILNLYDTGILPIEYAVELAKYDEHQESLLYYCFHNYGYESQTLRPFPKFIDLIVKNHLLQLNKAPFATKSTGLHPDGIACVTCPKTTGAQKELFEVEFRKKNSCLDRTCWNIKKENHIQIERAKIAKEKFGEAKAVTKAKTVPLITTDYYVRDDDKPKEAFLDYHKWAEIKKENDKCEFVEYGVFFNGERTGQQQLICRNPKCKKHLGKYSSSSSSSTDSEKDAANRLIRKEEIFDVKVGEAVRKRIFKLCAEKFAKDNGGKYLDTTGISKDFFINLLNRMWFLEAFQEEKTEKVIRTIISLWTKADVVCASRWNFEESQTITTKFLKTLDAEFYPRILFLFLHAHKGAMFFGQWKSQKGVKELAESFGLDYQRLDGEERLNHSAMKDKGFFRNYLQQLDEGKKDTPIPRLWSVRWKQKD